MIGNMPAWRALPAGVGDGLEKASEKMDQLMKKPVLTPADATPTLVQVQADMMQSAGKAAAEGNPAATAATSGAFAALTGANAALTATWTAASPVPGGQPAANVAYTQGIKAAAAAAASAAMAAVASMVDMHICPIPVPIPPHGPGVVTKGSKTVFIDKLPAARQDDKVIEACGGSDPIALGCQTVIIGDEKGSGGGGGGGGGAGGGGAATSDEAVRQQVVQAIAEQGAAAVADPDPEQVGPAEPVEEEQQDTWLGVRVREFDGTPVANQDVQATLDDGQVLRGQTDQDGYVRFEGVQPSGGEVSLLGVPEESALGPAGRRASAPSPREASGRRGPRGTQVPGRTEETTAPTDQPELSELLGGDDEDDSSDADVTEIEFG